MALNGVDNDTRGWIMCLVSGVACVLGASVICVDLLVQRLPGHRDFRIQDSSVFLACSLSLSFGVMLFSALYSMLPSAKHYLKDGGFSDQAAGFTLMGCFIGGFLGIQIVSRLLHRFMPSHVVDCDHSHDENVVDGHHSHGHSHIHFFGSHGGGRSRSRASSQHVDKDPYQRQRLPRRHSSYGASGLLRTSSSTAVNGVAPHEGTPLLGGTTPVGSEGDHNGQAPPPKRNPSSRSDGLSVVTTMRSKQLDSARSRAPTLESRRPSMAQVQRRVMSFVKDTKANCDEMGPCYGYTDPCGQECFKHINRSNSIFRHPQQSQNTLLRTTTGPFYPSNPSHSVFGRVNEENTASIDHSNVEPESPRSPKFRTSRARSRDNLDQQLQSHTHEGEDHHHHHHHHHDGDDSHSISSLCSQMEEGNEDEASTADLEAQHHHHVPTNAFLSIGLQTSMAIALHKFPEGFITYATNHANPTLGFNVFMALFVHNITEGFAMALPLYLALNSRARAMAWSAVLGGLSQPIGAAVAVAWLKIGDRDRRFKPDAVAYACLFALTAGIMVSVALQLFVESLSLNHNRNLCIFFAFLGMALLGLSSALVAGHD